jgi:hypothetical protein
MALGERMQPLLQMNFFSLKAQPTFLTCAEASPKIWHETCPADGAISIVASATRSAQARQKA